jgi:methylamine utilization protein MauE
MTVLVLAARAGLAVLLLAAGGAKLAGTADFAGAVALFLPRWLRQPGPDRAIAAAIAGLEIVAGAVSLAWPVLRWAGLLVLALAVGFTVVAAVGYARHRGRPCRCFGALTRRGFSLRSLVQAALITCAAVLALRAVPAADVDLSLTQRSLLLGAAAVLTLAAGTAARALSGGTVAAEVLTA